MLIHWGKEVVSSFPSARHYVFPRLAVGMYKPLCADGNLFHKVTSWQKAHQLTYKNSREKSETGEFLIHPHKIFQPVKVRIC